MVKYTLKRTCSVCGKEFIITSSKSKVCSFTCRAISKKQYNIQYKQNPEYKKKQVEYQTKMGKQGLDWATKNHELYLKYRKEYRKKYNPIYYKKNSDLVLLKNHNRRTREKSTKGFLTKIESFRKKMKEIGECIYCGSKENLTIEHLIPISKGGTNEIHNLFPACQKCNSSKHAKSWIKWYRSQIFYSLDREQKIIKFSKE